MSALLSFLPAADRINSDCTLCHSPWALALGTPVLVVAGLGHIIQGALHKKVRSVRARTSVSRTRLQGRAEDLAMSTT